MSETDVKNQSEAQTKTDARNRRRWKTILINPRYQLTYVLWIVGAGVLLTILNSSIFYHFVQENYSILVKLSPMTEEAKTELYSELYRIVFSLRVTSIVFVVVIGLWGLLLTHRTAGPLYHFNRVFNEIKKGNRSARIHLRPGDDFQEVAKTFNEMMDSIQNKD